MSIQYIRALAAIAVVVWHTGWARTVLGQAGVDLFFVVSGFVMMLVSRREDTPERFGLARILRIVPLYWAVTALVAWLDRPSETLLLSSLLFWPDRPFPVVLQGWSLDLEMFYYLLFALSLLAPVRWRLHVLAASMVLVCVVLPASAMLRGPLAAWSSPLAFEFLAGAVLFLFWRRRRLLTGARAWAVLLSGVAALAATHLIGQAPEAWLRVILWGIPAIAIVTGGLGIEAGRQLPHIPLLGALGEASYAMYLTHYVAMRAVAGPLHPLWAPVAVGLAVVWACLVGWLVHRVLELPMHRLSKQLLNALRRKAAVP